MADVSLEKVELDGEIFAFIFRKGQIKDGVNFYTPNDFNLQVGTMKWEKDHRILAHRHMPCLRKTQETNEVLFIKKGCLRVNFYNNNNKVFWSSHLNAEDFILLLKGAHGFEVIDDVEMIEIKNGPYAGENDKLRI